MYQRILVPIDGSPTSDQGLDEAIALARATGGSIRLLNVLDELVFTTGFETGATYMRTVLPALRQRSERILAAGRRRVGAATVGGRHADGRVLRETPLRRHRRGGRPVARRSHRHRHARQARREPHDARQRCRAGRAPGAGAGAARAVGREGSGQRLRYGRQCCRTRRQGDRRLSEAGALRRRTPRRLTPASRSRAAACRCARGAAGGALPQWMRTAPAPCSRRKVARTARPRCSAAVAALPRAVVLSRELARPVLDQLEVEQAGFFLQHRAQAPAAGPGRRAPRRRQPERVVASAGDLDHRQMRSAIARRLAQGDRDRRGRSGSAAARGWRGWSARSSCPVFPARTDRPSRPPVRGSPSRC